MTRINFPNDFISSKETKAILSDLNNCNGCSVKCGKNGTGLVPADFYGGRPNGVMILAENPGWQNTSTRNFILSLAESDWQKITLLRLLFYNWINGLNEKLKGDTFKQKTIFEIIEETLEEVLDDNLANRHSIYITDVCKACNYTLFDKMRDKSKSKVFKSCRDNFFKEELKKINPKVVLSLGGSAYSSYTALDGIEDTIYPSKESPTGRMSSNKNGDEGDHGKVYLSKNKRYLIPLIHPSGAARGSSGKDDDYGRTVKKALTHVADDFRLREKT
ncbi:MAG TPA: hypothetical protein ENH13_01660 [Euryarchaeota archaeon]|nr:uracil DNA glycosylase superfamily protein [archaeon BMS3Bbin16]HDH27820.1 hypothetical protein [Euryarchaeota archaeon]